MIAIVVATIYAEKSSVQSDVNKRLTLEMKNQFEKISEISEECNDDELHALSDIGRNAD